MPLRKLKQKDIESLRQFIGPLGRLTCPVGRALGDTKFVVHFNLFPSGLRIPASAGGGAGGCKASPCHKRLMNKVIKAVAQKRGFRRVG